MDNRLDIFIIICIVGFLFSFVVGYFFIKKEGYDGVIEIDTTQEEKDKYLFIFTIPVDEIPKKDRIIFQVRKKSK